MDFSFIIGLVSGLLVQLAPHYMPRLLPFRPAPGQVRWQVAQYHRLYGGYHNLAIWYAAALTVGLGAAWDFAFRILRGLAYPDPTETGLLLAPWEMQWVLAALFAGYACAIPASQGALRVILKHRYADYLIYRSTKAGYDKQLLNRVLPTLLLCTVAGFVCYFATTYAAFTDERVIIGRTFRPVLIYGYHEVLEIKGARGRVTINGKTRSYKNGVYVIEFTDGYQWHMRQAGTAKNLCDGYRAAAFVAARSGQAITGPELHGKCKQDPRTLD